MNSTLSYNERAWAIDVIAEINIIARPLQKSIRYAGGESTVRDVEGVLFPDVILFSSIEKSSVLQGWELKLPDTPIDDQELLDNAERKARALGLSSFLLWNVNQAHLYVQGEDNVFFLSKEWNCSIQCERSTVAKYHREWRDMLHQIIEDLNQYFDNNQIPVISAREYLGERLFEHVIDSCHRTLSLYIEAHAKRHTVYKGEVSLWWTENEQEYSNTNKYDAFAINLIVAWVNRILFSHSLRFHRPDIDIDCMGQSNSIRSAAEKYRQLSEKCDFAGILKVDAVQTIVDERTWRILLEFNTAISQVIGQAVDQSQYQHVLESTLSRSSRKVYGQFQTPKELASLLINATVEDIHGTVIDPCSGSGTIVHQLLRLKRDSNQEIDAALETVWFGDKYAVPLQLSTMAMTTPETYGHIVQAVRMDVFDIAPGATVEFTHPVHESSESRELPLFDAVVSNLPFIRSESIGRASSNGKERQYRSVVKSNGERITLSVRSDYYAYVLAKISEIVKPGGRVGVIVSNSWLGTEWGQIFRKMLLERYKIKAVITSGNGRWFQNAEVIGTLLVIERRDQELALPTEKVKFIVTSQHIEKWREADIDIIAGMVHSNLASSRPQAKVHQYSVKQLNDDAEIGVEWSAHFASLNWIESVKSALVPLSSLCHVARGERRGWDKMFMPKKGHKIEQQYLKPILKSSKNIEGWDAVADCVAFCCSRTIADLQRLGHTGALAWIKKYQVQKNGTGEPLPVVLSKAGAFWYEMKADTMADLAMTLNPDRKLVVYKFAERTFVNQRLIRMTMYEGTRRYLNILHALLNSTIGMFLIEAVGFGRGLGALDINVTKVKDRFQVVNPAVIAGRDADKILKAFSAMKARKPLPLEEELEMKDRALLDSIICKAIGIDLPQRQVQDSLKILYGIRKAV